MQQGELTLEFRRRVFFCGIITGLLGAIVLPLMRFPGLVGAAMEINAMRVFFSIVLACVAASSFCSLGTQLWHTKSLYMQILVRLEISLVTGCAYLFSTWLFAMTISLPLGLSGVWLLAYFMSTTGCAYGAAIIACYLIPDPGPEQKETCWNRRR